MEPVVAKGVNGTVAFDGRTLTITRTGLLARATAGKGEKRLPITSVTAVEWKPAGIGVRGFIRFTVPGGLERSARVGQRTQKAAGDENAVLFARGQTADFARLRETIETVLQKRT